MFEFRHVCQSRKRFLPVFFFCIYSYPVSLCASSTPTRVVPCVSNAASTFEYFKSKVFIFPTPYSYIHEKAKSIFRSGERGKKRFLKLSPFEYWQETFRCQTWKTTCRYVHLHILSNKAQFSVRTRGKYSFFFRSFVAPSAPQAVFCHFISASTVCTNTISSPVKASALTSLLGNITFTRMPACASPLMMWRQRRRDEDIMAQEVPGFQRTEIWTPAHRCSAHWRVFFYHIKKMRCSLLLVPLFIRGKRSESINALSSRH